MKKYIAPKVVILSVLSEGEVLQLTMKDAMAKDGISYTQEKEFDSCNEIWGNK